MRPIAVSNPNLDARGRRLRAALVPDNAPELQLVRRWLDSWSGVGLVLAGMAHQDYDVQFTAYAAGDWRATFYPVGIAHSIVAGSAYEPTPWRAAQRAARSAVNRLPAIDMGLFIATQGRWTVRTSGRDGP